MGWDGFTPASEAYIDGCPHDSLRHCLCQLYTRTDMEDLWSTLMCIVQCDWATRRCSVRVPCRAQLVFRDKLPKGEMIHLIRSSMTLPEARAAFDSRTVAKHRKLAYLVKQFFMQHLQTEPSHQLTRSFFTSVSHIDKSHHCELAAAQRRTLLSPEHLGSESDPTDFAQGSRCHRHQGSFPAFPRPRRTIDHARG